MRLIGLCKPRLMLLIIPPFRITIGTPCYRIELVHGDNWGKHSDICRGQDIFWDGNDNQLIVSPPWG